MYDLDEMHAVFRQLTGNPPERDVSRRTIQRHLQNGVNWVASELEIPKRTDTTTFALVADQFEGYLLPSEALQVQEVMWNGRHVDYTSIEEWRRDRVAWRTATSGDPREVAVDGREMIVYPPPSAGAISTDANLVVRYLSSTFLITDGGVPGFGDADVLLAIYAAAQEWLSFNNMDGSKTNLIAQVEKFIAMRLPTAKARYARMLDDYQPGTVAPARTSAAR